MELYHNSEGGTALRNDLVPAVVLGGAVAIARRSR